MICYATILYYIVPYCTTLCCAMLCCAMLWCATLQLTTVRYAVIYDTTLCAILYWTVLYSFTKVVVAVASPSLWRSALDASISLYCPIWYANWQYTVLFYMMVVALPSLWRTWVWHLSISQLDTIYSFTKVVPPSLSRRGPWHRHVIMSLYYTTLYSLHGEDGMKGWDAPIWWTWHSNLVLQYQTIILFTKTEGRGGIISFKKSDLACTSH